MVYISNRIMDSFLSCHSTWQETVSGNSVKVCGWNRWECWLHYKCHITPIVTCCKLLKAHIYGCSARVKVNDQSTFQYICIKCPYQSMHEFHVIKKSIMHTDCHNYHLHGPLGYKCVIIFKVLEGRYRVKWRVWDRLCGFWNYRTCN